MRWAMLDQAPDEGARTTLIRAMRLSEVTGSTRRGTHRDHPGPHSAPSRTGAQHPVGGIPTVCPAFDTIR